MDAAEGLALGTFLKALRQNRDITQAEVSSEIGISRPHYANIERGHTHPGRETLMALAAYYETSLDYLSALIRRSRETNKMDTAKPERLIELAITFLGQDHDLDSSRYARRLWLIQKVLREAQQEGRLVTPETVPGIVADALDRAPEDPSSQ